MRCQHLSLTNFRNYTRLELEFPSGVSVFCGNNAQGKSNLLEALYMLATTKSFRTNSERQLISLHTGTDEHFARISAEIERQETKSRLDIILVKPVDRSVNSPANEQRSTSRRAVQKQVRINQQPRRAVDVIGHLNMVLFTPEDIELISGPPPHRRRYLDIMLCQIDPHYLHTLNHYNRVLAQRNALLRQLRDRPAQQDLIDYWTEQLVELGSQLVASRTKGVIRLNAFLAEIHPRLVSDRTDLKIIYRSNATTKPPAMTDDLDQSFFSEDIPKQFNAQLSVHRQRELSQGVTVVGPHRDDLAFMTGEIDIKELGSRGQQRSAILAIKLAEIEFMLHRIGERPVLLLDDVLSELDPQRRELLQAVIADHDQVLITTTELRPFNTSFLAAAEIFDISKGSVRLRTGME